MSDESKISWTDGSFNFWEGCTKPPGSPECANCYAENRNIRWAKGENWGPGAPRRFSKPAFENVARADRQAGKGLFLRLANGKRVWTHKLEEGDNPVGATPARPIYFVLSLGDFFDQEVAIEWKALAMQAMMDAQNLDFMVLTKRSAHIMDDLNAMSICDAIRETTRKKLADWIAGFPPQNIALGTTIGHKRSAGRLEELAAVPACRRFISMEPLLGAIPEAFWNSPAMTAIHLVIVGGESGAKARPMLPEWVKDIEHACDMLGVPFHFKQWGEWVPTTVIPFDWTRPATGNLLAIDALQLVAFDGRKHMRADTIHRVGVKAAGYMLPGHWTALRERREILTFPLAEKRTPWVNNGHRNFPSEKDANDWNEARPKPWAIMPGKAV